MGKYTKIKADGGPIKKVRISDKGIVKDVPINTPEYKQYYNSKTLAKATEDPGTLIAAQDISPVEATAKKPTWLTFKEEAIKNYPEARFRNEYFPSWGKPADSDSLPQNALDEYNKRINNTVAQRLLKERTIDKNWDPRTQVEAFTQGERDIILNSDYGEDLARNVRLYDSELANKESFSDSSDKADLLRRQSQAIGDKLSLQRLPYVGQYIPGILDVTGGIGSMASNLGAAPDNWNRGNYLSAIGAVAAPIGVGRLASIGAPTTAQFVNNVVNPLAGTGSLIKGVVPASVKTITKAKNLREAVGTFAGIPTERSLPRLSEQDFKAYKAIQELGRRRDLNRPIADQYEYALLHLPEEHIKRIYGKSKDELASLLKTTKESADDFGESAINYQRNGRGGIDITQGSIDLRRPVTNEIRRRYNIPPSDLINTPNYGPVINELDPSLMPHLVDNARNNNSLPIYDDIYDDIARVIGGTKNRANTAINNQATKVRQGVGNYISEYPTHRGDVKQNVQALFLKGNTLKGVHQNVANMATHGVKSGDVFAGSLNTSHSSYLPQLRKTFEYTGGDKVFLNYKPMNRSGYLSQAGYTPDEIARYLNTAIDTDISRGRLPSNIQRPFLDEGNIYLPHYGVKQYQYGGYINNNMNNNYADGGPIKGKKKPTIKVNDLNDPGLIAHNDSLALYNAGILQDKTGISAAARDSKTTTMSKNYATNSLNYLLSNYGTTSTGDDDKGAKTIDKLFKKTKYKPIGVNEYGEEGSTFIFKKPERSYEYSPYQEKLNINSIPINGSTNRNTMQGMNVSNPPTPTNPKPWDSLQLYSGWENLGNQGSPVGYYDMDGSRNYIGLDEYNQMNTPQYSGGGPIRTNNPNDPMLLAYNDSLNTYNNGTASLRDQLNNFNTARTYDEFLRRHHNIIGNSGRINLALAVHHPDVVHTRSWGPQRINYHHNMHFVKPKRRVEYIPYKKTKPLSINQVPITGTTNSNTVQGRNIPTPQSSTNPKPYNAINLYTAHQNLANAGKPIGQINEDGKWRDIMADEYNAIMGSSVQGGTKLENTNYAMGGRMNQAQMLNQGKMRMGSGEGNGLREYASDYGNFLLDGITGVAEGITGAEIYNPNYNTKLGKIAGAVNNQSGKMIGKFAPMALNAVAPGVGTAVGVAGKAIGTGLNASKDEQSNEQSNAQLNLGNNSMLPNVLGNNMEGIAQMETMGAAQSFSFKQGGLMHINEGGTHEQNALGGVPIGPNALVEQGETINNDFVFSDRLKPKGSKRTYAQLSKSVDTKYKLRPDDKLSKEAKQMDLDRLAMQQEAQKDEMSTKYMQKAMACGGKIKGFGGQIMGPISQSMNVTNGQNTLLAMGGLMSNFMEQPPVYQNPANLSNQYAMGGNMYDAGGPLEDFTYDNPQTAAYPIPMAKPNIDIPLNNGATPSYLQYDENGNPDFGAQQMYNPNNESYVTFPNSPLTNIQSPTPYQIQSGIPVPQMIQPNIEQIKNSVLPGAYNYVNNPEANFMGQKQGNAFDKSSGAAQNPYPEVGNTGYLTNLAGNLIKAGMVATSKPPIYNPSVKLNRLNPTAAERLAMQEGRREIQGTKDIIRNNATSSGQYLTNASLMGSNAANKLAGTIGGIRQGYDQQNVGIGNQEAQLNQQITAANNLAKETFRDNRLNQYNKILDSVIGANQQRFATDVHANNYQNQAISMLKTKDFHVGRKDKNGMFEVLDINGNIVGTLDNYGVAKDLLGNPIK